MIRFIYIYNSKVTHLFKLSYSKYPIIFAGGGYSYGVAHPVPGNIGASLLGGTQKEWLSFPTVFAAAAPAPAHSNKTTVAVNASFFKRKKKKKEEGKD